MAGIGAIVLDSAGSVTAPSSMPLTFPTADTTTVNPYALPSFAPMPAERGVMWADGVSPIRHYITSVLGTGLLAPTPAPTVTPTGAKAVTILDTNQAGAYTIVDGDNLFLINSALSGPGYRYIFKTTLTGFVIANEVLIGGSTENALINLKKAINQTGTEGVTYATYRDNSGEITATTLTATDLTIESNGYGTAYNSYVATWAGGAGPQFEDAGGTARTTFRDGSDPTGSSPVGGAYQYGYAFVREDDGAQSGLSTSVEANNGTGGQIDVAGMTASADASVDYNRVYRTTSGGGLFYRVDEVAAATTTYADDESNDTITNFGALPYDPTIYRSYRAGLPVKVRYLARFQGRWFGAGAVLAATYQAGTASVTNGDATVTFTGYPRQSWVGRTFQVNSVSETYSIMSVDEAANAVELDRNYEGTTAGSASFTVKDLRDPYEIYWSEPGLPNNWPVQNSLKGPSSMDGLGCTGLYAAFESVIYFTRDSVWRITGNDGIYQAHLVTDRAGCVSGHSVVMDGERMYWLGADGVYGWTGSGDPVHLSTPPQQDVAARGQDDTIARLTLAHAHRVVAVADPVRSEIRWYMPLDGERTNRYCLVLDAHSGSFSLDTCEDVTAAWRLEEPDGSAATFTGDIQGCIFQQGLSTSDGAYGFEQVQTVSSSTVRSATVASTPFPTSSDGLNGVPVWAVASDGTFSRSCVASNTSSALTYRRFQTAQTATTQMVVGGILMWVQTGRFDFGDRMNKKIVPGYTVAHSPESDGQYFFFYAYEQEDFKIPTVGWTVGDLTVGATEGDFGPRRRFRARKDAVLHGWGLCCVEPGCDAKFAGVTIEIKGPDGLEP